MKQIAFTHTIEGYKVAFYKDSSSEDKFQFMILGEPELTARLLASCKKKRLKGKEIKFAISGIAEKIRAGVLDTPLKSTNVVGLDPVSELNELSQRYYAAPIRAMILDVEGPEHSPTVTVVIFLPDGTKFSASAGNQREARKIAAKKALIHLEIQKKERI